MTSALIRCLFTTIVFSALSSSFPLNDAWLGTWKLDRALSHFTGASITIVRIRRGYHFDFGAVSFDVGDDGKDYVTVPTRSTSLRIIGEGAWLRVHKIAGKEIDHSILRISSDGRTLSIHTISVGVSGTTHASDEKLERVGGGEGLAGTWRSNVLGANVATIIVVEDARRGRLRWEYPDQGQFYIAALNDEPVPLLGPRSVPGVTIALRKISRTEFTWIEFVAGKRYTAGTDVLSPDARTLEETSWQVSDPTSRERAVYQRQ